MLQRVQQNQTNHTHLTNHGSVKKNQTKKIESKMKKETDKGYNNIKQ
jgi:ribosomal protein S30